MRSVVFTYCPPSEVREDGPGGLLSGGLATEVRGPEAGLERAIHSRFYCRRLLVATESVTQHHGDGPEHGERIGASGARYVGRGAVNGLEEPGPARPHGRAGQHPDRAGEHRGLVAEDVAEQVLGEDHIEVRGPGD